MHGVLAPVVTPFRPDLSPDVPALLTHCRWLLDCGVGLVLFGTTSEANSLSLAERLELLEHVTGAVDPGRVLVGSGCCALPDTVALTRRATELKTGGVLMLPPFYYKAVSDEGLFRSYAYVLEKVPEASVYLYHIPPIAQVGLSRALIERLLERFPGNILGIKDSSGEPNHTHSLLDLPFAVFPGSESYLLSALRAGARGCISATANINPKGLAELYAHPTEERQARVAAVREALRPYPMIPALKALLGWPVVRPPLVELPAAQLAELREKLPQD